MPRFAFLAISAVLLWGLAAAGPAFAQSDALPPIGADGMIQPLTVNQLDPAERATYAALAPDSDSARKFLYTRGYLRYCRLVAAQTLPPLQLPPLPERSNWNRQFLSPDEATKILDLALGMKMMARMK
jgi:hypothetical protein